MEPVELGTQEVDRAGDTKTEIVSSICRVTDIMGEISSAGNEQASGVSQIGEVVQSMGQVTQQNAALVEQMAAAAGSLEGQAVPRSDTSGPKRLRFSAQSLHAPHCRTGFTSWQAMDS